MSLVLRHEPNRPEHLFAQPWGSTVAVRGP
jgi:hypothetical protein